MLDEHRRKRSAKCAIRAVALLVPLFVLHNQTLRADARADIRQKILAGEQVSLDKFAPENARTIDANWIKQAVLKHVRVDIHRAVIQGPLDLHDATIEQEFTLAECLVKNSADFSHAIFKRDFFASDTVFASGLFSQGTTFEQAATFQRTRFEGVPIAFDNAHFIGRFDAEGARFASKGGGTAVFTHVRFDDTADFASAVFTINAHFITTQFSGQGYFPGTRFAGSADFSRAHFLDIATFGGGPPENYNARFVGQAVFIETQFDSKARFSGVSFNDRTDFGGAHFNNDAYFEDSVFQGPTSFRSTVFRTVYFATAEVVGKPQFGSSVDLFGCTYDRIQVNWRLFLSYPDGRSRIQPYDRQPYIELEGVLRRSGAEADADDIYAERRRVERTGMDRWRKFWDYVYLFIANYGIDLCHEFTLAVILLAFGTLIFTRPGAVQPDETARASTPNAASSLPSKSKIRWHRALLLAVRQFLPFSLPIKPQWTPSRLVLWRLRRWELLTAASYANFLQIIGWILIPLAAAALAGILRHAGQ
jgi:Pentapeptide repeats (9 copies)